MPRRTGEHGGHPLVIAHRGASGDRPEHTLAAYREAMARGADYIEPDLVATRDGVLVARHENEISGTTDVARRPQFAHRRTSKVIGGRSVHGWFTEDFTLDELKMLRAVERLPALRPHSALHDGLHEVPTLDEVLDLAARNPPVGVYAEIKNPAHFRSVGVPLEARLVEALERRGETPIFIQSFEPTSLRILSGMTDLSLIQLIDSEARIAAGQGGGRAGARLTTPRGLERVARYARGIGPHKDLLISPAQRPLHDEATGLVADAHAAGLLVHAWTFRSENAFLPEPLRRASGGRQPDPAEHGDWRAEYLAFFAAGVDGVFTDHPHHALAARASLTAREERRPPRPPVPEAA